MLFNSPVFLLGFLPLVAVLFFTLSRFRIAWGTAWLVLSSLIFYGWWNPKFVVLLLASITFNYCAGILIARAPSRRRARLVTTSAVALDLILLAYFKYTDFLIRVVDAFDPSRFPYLHIILPLGISFFTFTQIAFLIDAYRGRAREYRFGHYALFVSYFPHLIAGPILHHSDMMPQFEDPKTYRFRLDNAVEGVSILLIGLAKKVVIADSIAPFVIPVFSAADMGQTVTFLDGWAAALGYAFQLYFDFSGYSDMAIGISRIFGVKLPLNFNSPYRAGDLIEFWRRWHMTLSAFLREYLYIPLGGNRYGKGRRFVNLFITMSLGGLWHGANWTFVVWGALHGAALIVCHAWHGVSAARPAPTGAAGVGARLRRSLASALTFVFVVAAWVVFRAETLSGATTIWAGMCGLNGFAIPEQIGDLIPILPAVFKKVGRMPLLGNNSVLGTVEECGLLVISAALCWGFPATQDMGRRLRLGAILVSFAFVVEAVFFRRAPSPFLYFQF